MVLRLLLGFLLFSVLLFVPAGTIYWEEAWAFILILTTYGILLHFLILRKSPKVLQSRRHYTPAFHIDTLILLLAGICLLLMFIIIGLDVGRYQWTTHLVPPLVKYLGFSSFVTSIMLYMLVMRENMYLSRVIEVQEDQRIVESGPYAFVRHPMYLGNLIFTISIPLALGSFIALIPAILFIVCFVPRILFEEKILKETLPEYHAYMLKVPYRIIPRIW